MSPFQNFFERFMFDIGFFELLIIMGIAVLVVGPENLPRLARAIGKGWGEFQSTFSDLKQEVLDEGENIKKTANLEDLEQEVSAATKVDVDVNLDLNQGNDIKPDSN
ncbi:MAG: twin-arginine translocase TatA/TatE family subunit [Nitrospinaceae bacterium]